MSNFCPSSIRYLTYCVTINVIKVWKCSLSEFFSRTENAVSSKTV